MRACRPPHCTPNPKCKPGLLTRPGAVKELGYSIRFENCTSDKTLLKRAPTATCAVGKLIMQMATFLPR